MLCSVDQAPERLGWMMDVLDARQWGMIERNFQPVKAGGFSSMRESESKSKSKKLSFRILL
jgi:hypothetical protein